MDTISLTARRPLPASSVAAIEALLRRWGGWSKGPAHQADEDWPDTIPGVWLNELAATSKASAAVPRRP